MADMNSIRKRQPSFAEVLAREASDTPEADLLEEIAMANAGYHSFGVPMLGPRPRFSNEKLNAGGYTMTEGPMKGQVVIANPEKLSKTNVLGHEAYHARALDSGMPKTKGVAPGAIGNLSTRKRLNDAMEAIQPHAKVAGPYWGLNPNSSAEEQIANLVGYEASLPKGTSIIDTEIGKKILSNQELKDYYFTQSSVPFGGIWEGQSQPSLKQKVQTTMRELLNKFRK